MTESVEFGGRRLRLSNLDKRLYPGAHGCSKAEVISYYASIAPVLLPHLRGRPVTLRRFPNGVQHKNFVQKHAGADTPDWIRTELVPGRNSEPVRHAVLEEDAALVWAANLAALEQHVPQWRFGARGAARHQPKPPDLMVFDLDPGAPAGVVECCAVAVTLRERLAEDGLRAWPKTSGGAGLHLLVPVRTKDAAATSAYARHLAQELTGELPEQVLWRMNRDQRPGKVFVDWSQNNPAKTTVAPYSLRGRDSPTVSTPLTWTEVESCTTAASLTFTAPMLADRIDEHGDLLAGMAQHAAVVPATTKGP